FLSPHIGSEDHFGLTTTSDFERCAKKLGFFTSCVCNVSFFLTESQFQALFQEGFDLLSDFFSEDPTPGYSHDPIIRVSQIFHPDEVRVINNDGRKGSHLFDKGPEFLCFRFPLFHHSPFSFGEIMVRRISALLSAFFSLHLYSLYELIKFM